MIGGDDRTIAPTPRRLAEARRAGDAPRSRELTSAVAALAGIAALAVLGGELWEAMSSLLQCYWSAPAIRFSETNDVIGFASSIPRIAVLLAAMLGMPAIAALLAAALQSGFRPAVRFPAPSWSHVSPPAGARRLLAGVGIGPLGGLTVKVLAVCLFTGWSVNRTASEFAGGDTDAMAAAIGRLLIGLGLALTAMFVLLAIGDWLSRRRRFWRSLRMTVSEARAEAQASKSPRRQRTRRRQRVSAHPDAIRAEPSLQAVHACNGTAAHLPSDPLIS